PAILPARHAANRPLSKVPGIKPLAGPNSQNRKKALVPLAGLEPARCCHHLILSQARLPIPPQGQAAGIIAAKRGGSTGSQLPSVPRPSERRPSAATLRTDARARAGAQGCAARSHPFWSSLRD